MAKNTGNKRVAVKWLRDGIKSQYPKGEVCEITGSTEDLEFHHYNTLSLIFDKYCQEEGITIKSDEDVLACRDAFYEKYWYEVVEHGVTLTNELHKKLHKTYGKQPALSTADKQVVWVKRMRDKHEGTDATSSEGGGRFSSLSVPRKGFANLI